MEIREVTGAADARLFIEMAPAFYANDPEYIRPMDMDIEAVFDPEKNRTFQHGELARWILFEGRKPIGRIAAFINHRESHKNDQPTGGCGFFECIDRQEAANLLFDTAKNWLAVRGMEAMDGPINFGERDSWWGLMVEGFHNPIYKMNYNPPYYRALFEQYGFQTYFEQYCFNVDTKLEFNPIFYERASRAAERGGYTARHIRKKELEQYARDFTSIYNRAWVSHGGMKSLTEEQVIKTFKTMKPVMDEEIVWFTYHGDEPVAFWVNLPELNQLFKYCNGKFGWWQKLVFFYHKLMGHCDKFTGIAFGIVPEHQGKGLESFMILSAERVIRKNGIAKYNQLELQWIADFHPKMLRIPKSLGATQSRMLITYRYLFDREKPFVRHPTL